MADTTSIPRPLPVRSRLREPRTIHSDWQAFLSWPGAASSLTLGSAACLLGGLWGVVAPSIGDPDQITARLLVVAVMALYLGSLLGVIHRMCRWQVGNPDAIAASVVGSLCAVGIGIALDLIADDRPMTTLALGSLGYAILIALWRTWNTVTGGSTPRGLGAALHLLLGGSCIGPGLMGLRGQWANSLPANTWWLHPMGLWLLGYLVLLLSGVLVLRSTAARDHEARAERYLSSAAMRQCLLVVMLGAAGVHAYVLGYSANLDLLISDFAGGIALVVLILNEWRHRAHGAQPLLDGLALLLPMLVLAGCVAVGVWPADDAQLNRGPVPLHGLLRIVVAPDATMVWLGVGALIAWWRTRRSGLLVGGIGCLAVAVLVTPIGTQGVPGLHGLAAGLVVVMALLGWAWWQHQLRALMAAVLLLEVLLMASPALREVMTTSAWLRLLLVLPAGTVLAIGLLRQPLLRRGEMLAAVWLAMGGIAVGSDGNLDGVTVILSALWSMLILLVWRLRHDPAVLWPLGIPLIGGVLRYPPDNKAWLAVAAAFVMLGLALAIGHRRIRSPGPAPALGPGLRIPACDEPGPAGAVASAGPNEGS